MQPGDFSFDRDVQEFSRGFGRLASNIRKFVRGQDDVVHMALVCLFAEGHILIEGVPGIAKTSLARAIARSISDCQVKRIQFTPDLLPADVTGTQFLNSTNSTLVFKPGPIFANIVLGDEINRASPKTQSAMLEVMAERQVTVDGEAQRVPSPFLCIATQNPIEHLGTYPLPEAQLDRFMMMLRMSYPAPSEELEVVRSGVSRQSPESTVEQIMSIDELRRMIHTVRRVAVGDRIQEYIVRLVAATRVPHDLIRLGVSPRGGVAIAQAAQAQAASRGSSFVTTDDVKSVTLPVLRHRLLLTPEAAVRMRDADAVLHETVLDLPTPESLYR